MAGSTGSSPRPRKRAELDELQDLGDWANIDTFEWDETDVTLSTAEGLRWLQSIGIVSRDVSLVSAHLLISKCTIALSLSLSVLFLHLCVSVVAAPTMPSPHNHSPLLLLAVGSFNRKTFPHRSATLLTASLSSCTSAMGLLALPTIQS